MKKKKVKKGRNQGCPIAKDLRTPKYKKRVVPDKKKKGDREKCRDAEMVCQQLSKKKMNSLNNAKKKLKRILAKQKGKCFYCDCRTYRQEQKLLPVATVDHVIPLSKGGTHSIKNLVVACSDCNQAKGCKTKDEYMQELIEQYSDNSNLTIGDFVK